MLYNQSLTGDRWTLKLLSFYCFQFEVLRWEPEARPPVLNVSLVAADNEPVDWPRTNPWEAKRWKQNNILNDVPAAKAANE